MRVSSLIMAALLGAFALGGCAKKAEEIAAEAAIAPPNLIETGAWRIVALRADGLYGPPAAPATLTLDRGRLVAETGCNDIKGNYDIAQEALGFYNLNLGRKACAPAQAALEAALYAALAKTSDWRVGGGGITLMHREGVELARLASAP